MTCCSLGQGSVAFLSEHHLAPFYFLFGKQKSLFNCFSWLKTKVMVIMNVCQERSFLWWRVAIEESRSESLWRPPSLACCFHPCLAGSVGWRTVCKPGLFWPVQFRCQPTQSQVCALGQKVKQSKSIIASKIKKQKILIYPTQVRSIVLYLKVKPSILLCKLLGLMVAEEIISGGLNSRI